MSLLDFLGLGNLFGGGTKVGGIPGVDDFQPAGKGLLGSLFNTNMTDQRKSALSAGLGMLTGQPMQPSLLNAGSQMMQAQNNPLQSPQQTGQRIPGSVPGFDDLQRVNPASAMNNVPNLPIPSMMQGGGGMPPNSAVSSTMSRFMPMGQNAGGSNMNIRGAFANNTALANTLFPNRMMNNFNPYLNMYGR